jgi:hypothetical protein
MLKIDRSHTGMHSAFNRIKPRFPSSGRKTSGIASSTGRRPCRIMLVFSGLQWATLMTGITLLRLICAKRRD